MNGDRNGRGFRGRGRGFYRGRPRYFKNRGGNQSKQRGSSDGNSPEDRADHSRGGGRHRQKEITTFFDLTDCPFKGWRLYFPREGYAVHSITVSKVKWLMDYFRQNESVFDHMVLSETGYLDVDYERLVADKTLTANWPVIRDDVVNSPEHTLACMGLAIHEVLTKTYNEKTASEKLDFDKGIVPFIRPRIVNYTQTTTFKSLGAALCGKLITLCGTVVRVAPLKPLCITMAFQCKTCEKTITLEQPEGKFSYPSRCMAETEEGLCCTGDSFEPLPSSPETKTVDSQSIRLQESFNEDVEPGRVPRSIDCELAYELVNVCCPGDIVSLTGVVKVMENTATKEKTMFGIYIDAVYVYNTKDTSSAGPNEETSKGAIMFSPIDYTAIQKIHMEPNLFQLLVASLCPSIYGNELVKAGLLLGLLGGNRDFAKERTGLRSDIHVLVVGDPGLGKSQMLQACSVISPRSVYVCGNASTKSGLTVTLTRDSAGNHSNGSDYVLEAGALILADQGCCFIDEFDKMSGQHQALLEAMEQQSVSIAKAGIVCSLPARAAILAAANPVGGHYNKARTVAENLKISPALLSRFDLVFLLLDRSDKDMDSVIVNHLLSLHGSKRKQNATSVVGATSSAPDTRTLLDKLRCNHDELDLLPMQLLRKYIAYARQYVRPRLGQAAKKELQQFYLKLRRNHYAADSTPVTTRQLESLIRLAVARAKAELRVEVTKDDACDAIELMRSSLDDVFKDEMGGLDFRRSQNGSGMSARNQGKKFIELLQNYGDRNYKNVFTFEEMRQVASQAGLTKAGNHFGDFIDSLNIQGYFLKKGPRLYQLQASNF